MKYGFEFKTAPGRVRPPSPDQSTAKVYRGPYKDNAPDLIPGYQRAERRGRPAGAQFFESLDLLGLLVRAQRAGQVQALTQLARDLRLAPEQCERLLGRMEAAGWVAQAAGDGWVLAREAGAIRAADVYRLFVFDAPQVAERYAGLEQRMEATLAELFAGAEAAEEPERRTRRFELFSLRREQK